VPDPEKRNKRPTENRSHLIHGGDGGGSLSLPETRYIFDLLNSRFELDTRLLDLFKIFLNLVLGELLELAGNKIQP
jgi:hypothetical protein